MQTLAQIRELLESRGLAPRKALGQNFLIDQNLVSKLVSASGVGPGMTALEVGPGTGTLTEALLEAGCRVVAVELDEGLASLLEERLAGHVSAGRLALVRGDCMARKTELNPAALSALGAGPFRLVANLPYNAATPLMMTLLIEHRACEGMWVTIQREVADRLLAEPGSKEYGPLSVVARAVGVVSRVAVLPPECFWPRPSVTSAMASVVRRGEPLARDVRALSDFCRVAFGQRRKQLGSVLGRDFPWPLGLTGRERAEELSVERLIELSARFVEARGGRVV